MGTIKKWWYDLLGIPEVASEPTPTLEIPAEIPVESGTKPKKPKAPRKSKVKKD